MKPIAIFRHAKHEGPGYLADFLDKQKLVWQLIAIDEGAVIPSDASAYAGLIFMGGPMSVNDDLPWINPVLNLIRDAVARDIPVLGHCLGGQLMSKAMGGVVSRNPIKEIGWGEVQVADNEIAHTWFTTQKTFPAFHWHGETFSLPQGATLVLSSAHCQNQAYVLGKHLAMQCHVEMTAQLIADWCVTGADEIVASLHSPAVQTAQTMLAQIPEKLPTLNEVAAALYRQWIKGLNQFN